LATVYIATPSILTASLVNIQVFLPIDISSYSSTI